MEDWGIFVKEKELFNMIANLRIDGYEPFEVRELTFMERVEYIRDDIVLFFGKPYVIMFKATEEEWKTLVKKLGLIDIF